MWQSIKNIYHLGNAMLANIAYGFPGRKLTVIGVTGTDGKTTTTSLIYHILQQAGKKVAMVSTVDARIGEEVVDTGFHVTTPSSYQIQELLQKAAVKNMEYVVLEVTSHALDQHRAFGVPFTIGVITNITHEHLDYHKTYDRYVKAKMKLLKAAQTAVINKDDESYPHLAKLTNKKIVTYGLTKDSDINPDVFPFTTKLLGEFNKYNCLAAIAVTKLLNINTDAIKKAVASYVPPKGRQEVAYDKDFTVFVDFAHTPHSFKQLLPEIRKQTKGKLIHVFGAASMRDTVKRPIMGKISAEYADVIILTAEDPRKESVETINKEILKGMTKKEKVISVTDRKEAIQQAIAMAKKGDTVLLTGKGHEKSMNYGRGEEPWDEVALVQEAIEEKEKRNG